MTGDTVEIMKKNGSGGERRGPIKVALQSFPKGKLRAPPSSGEQHLPRGPARQAQFTSSISTRQVPCGSVLGSLITIAASVPSRVTVNVCQSPRNATFRVSLFQTFQVQATLICLCGLPLPKVRW